MWDWFLSISLFEQFLYGTAAFSTLFFVIKCILLLFGISSITDADVDDALVPTDGADVHYFSVIGILSFLAIGSWGAILAFSITHSHALALITGCIAGTAEMIASVKLIRFLRRLQDSGNVNTTQAIGKIGEVYLTIPPVDLGEGKVNIVINSGLKEFQAVSLDKSSIPTGTRVRVVDIQNDDTLVVQREAEELE